METAELRRHAITVAIWLARVAVVATFVVAAVPKVIDLQGFATDVANYQTFPHYSVHLLAAGVPPLELVGAASILTGVKRRGGAILLGGMTLAFTVLLVVTLMRGIDISCGCFGSDPAAGPLSWLDVARDVLLFAGIVVAALEVPRRLSPTTPGDTP